MLTGRTVVSNLRFGVRCFVALPTFQSPSFTVNSSRLQPPQTNLNASVTRPYASAKVTEKKTVILSSKDLRKAIPGGKTVFGSLSLNLELGKKIGVVGVNGTGKSTLIKTLGGFDKEFEGQLVTSHGIEIGYLAQEPELDTTKTVIENIYDGVSGKLKMLDRMAELKKLLNDDEDNSDLVSEKIELEKRIRDEGIYSLKNEVKEIMEALGCPPPNSKVNHLSGGEKRRIALCRLLVSKPDLLLLDEPTNHIDARTVLWLETYLTKFEGSILLITHDKTFLNNVTDEILELDRGSCYFHKGKYNDWLASKDQRNEQNKQKLKEVEKFINIQNTKQTKSNTKAREALIEKAKQEKESIVEAKNVLPFSFPKVFVNDKNFISVEALGRMRHGRFLFKDLSFKIQPGDVIGVIGPNGAGKTTLIKTILNQEEPDCGRVFTSRESTVNYLEQSRMGLDPTTNVFESVSEGDRRVSNAYLTKFNLKGSMQTQQVSTLSGGERNRVHLAKMIKDPATFLLLDEPTNDLDKEVVANLEAAIKEFNGGILIASHDIEFLSRVCNTVISIDPSSDNTIYFKGTVEQFKKKFPMPAPKPAPMKMPSLTKKQSTISCVTSTVQSAVNAMSGIRRSGF